MDHEMNPQERAGGAAVAQRFGAAVAPACATRTIRLLTLVEADVISGSAKAVVELAHEAARQLPGLPQLDISAVTFVRGQKPNQLVSTLRGIGVTVETVEESGAFDPRILPQLRRIF